MELQTLKNVQHARIFFKVFISKLKFLPRKKIFKPDLLATIYFFSISEDITITNPPSPIFAKNEWWGLVIEKFFIKDFLSKKFSGASRRSLEGGGSYSDIP